MRGVNKAIIVGTLGTDPDMKYTADSKAIANLSVATSEDWKDKQTGQKQSKTEWHRVVAFGRLAEIMGEYLKKGSQVYIEGKIQTRKWQDQNGQDRYSTEIVANELQMLGGKQDNQSGVQQQAPTQQQDYRGHQGSNQANPTYSPEAKQQGQQQQASQQQGAGFDDGSGIPF